MLSRRTTSFTLLDTSALLLPTYSNPPHTALEATALPLNAPAAKLPGKSARGLFS